MVISARNPVHSVLFLILTFVNAAGLFMLTGAEFLAMILLVVYVGAVAVLFLFVVMMLDVDFAELRQRRRCNMRRSARLVGLILAAELIVVLGGYAFAPKLAGDGRQADPAICATRSNTAALGDILYTDYIYYFQIAGLVLLVAMIGAIVLTLRHKEGVKRQSIAAQVGAHAGDGDRDQEGRDGQGHLMSVGISHYLTVAAILFTLGVFGIFLNRKNVIVILMSVELILLAVNINFVAFSAALGDLVGQVFALFVLTVAAAEAAIGLAILVVFYRNRGSIAVEDVNMMKG